MAVEDWDELAPHYDRWYQTPVGSFALEVEIDALLDLAHDLQGSDALEVGCGSARFARAFARQGAHVVGVDPSRSMLEIAAESGGSELSLCRAPGERLPFADRAFDVVLIVTVLEFVGDPQDVLAEAWRVLQPGGEMLVGVLNAWSLWTRTRKLRKDETIYDRTHFFSPPEMLHLLRPFGSVRWRGALFLPPWVKGPRRAWWKRLEKLGGRGCPFFGAFLAAAARKPKKEE